ncbi:MAG: YigZ family protein [Clostridia bacterium]|nr:YigZ family protein [Clostridia bacterium]
MQYRTIALDGCDRFTEKRSVFIGYAKPVATEQQAVDFINSIRQKHWDATHNCYAYVIRENQIRRYSDDGEPSGTAGVPMLEVLMGEELWDVCVVATRYFGGTLLGTGGLVRAYSKTARIAIDSAQMVTYTLCSVGQIGCSYTAYGRVNALVMQHGGMVDDTAFTDSVTLKISIPPENIGALNADISEATAGQSRFEAQNERFVILG